MTHFSNEQEDSRGHYLTSCVKEIDEYVASFVHDCISKHNLQSMVKGVNHF